MSSSLEVPVYSVDSSLLSQKQIFFLIKSKAIEFAKCKFIRLKGKKEFYQLFHCSV